MNVQRIKLNIIPGGVLPVVHVSQYDHNAGGLVFDIYNGGELYELPEGTTASIEGTKPDEYGFLYPAADVSGHSVTIDVMEQMTVVPGKVICELRLAHQQDNVGTINFILAVEPAGLSDDTEVSETDIPLLREAIEAGQQALQSAEQAELSADRAEAEADRAEEAADNLTAIRTSVPGEIVEVGDAKAAALQQFRADFEPRQDLHGYERPWAGGTNINLIDDNVRSTSSTTVVVGQSVGYNTPSVAMKAGTYTFSAVYRNGATSRGYMKKTGDTSNTMLWDVGSNHATFTLAEDTTCSFWLYNAAGVESADVNAQVEAGTEATEYTPYANICPIEGTTGPITVTRAGKNILPNIVHTVTKGGVTMTRNADGTLTFNGTATQNLTFYLNNETSGTPDTVSLKPGTYTLSGCPEGGSGSTYRIQFYRYHDGEFINQSYYENGAPITITAEEGDGYRPFVRIANNYACDNLTFRPQLEVGDTATAYEPFIAHDEYAITIPSEAGTVYAGTLTINSDGSGQILIDYGGKTYDGSESWVTYQTHGYHVTNTDMKRGTWWADPKTLCNEFKKVADNSAIGIRPGVNNQEIYVVAVKGNLADVTSLATWKTWLASNPLTITYPLATPITYPLTGAQVVQMLQGSNVLWMDVDGQIQITYITASQLSGIVEELDELQADVAEMQPVVADLQTNAVKKSDIVQTGTVTTAGQYAVDARQLNPDLSGTIAKRITDLETGAATDVKTADITRATNITAVGTKVVDAYELNASKTGTLAKKIADAASAASAAQSDATAAGTAAGNANTALGGFKFGFTQDQRPGYILPGADTVIPFSDIGNLTIADEIITYRVTSSVDDYTTTRTVQGEIVAAGIIGLSSSDGARNGNPTCTFSGNTMTYHSGYTYSATVTATVRIWYIPT